MTILSAYQLLVHTLPTAQGEINHIWKGTILSDTGFESHVDRKNRFQEKETIISLTDLD